MRGSDFNVGLRGTLFEAKHYERMSSAVWLYGWLVLRQTRQDGTTGWVLGGKPISYREIEEETGFEPRTLERWMRILREGGYIETRTAPGGVIVQITKAKKFSREPAVRNFAEGARRNADVGTQNCGGSSTQKAETSELPSRIGSGYLVRKEKDKGKGSCLGKANTEESRRWGAASGAKPQFPQGREASMVWRNLKQESVRRELRVGEGPRVCRRGEEENESV
jgi:DNA-binding transcriptional ArsR family regulator